MASRSSKPVLSVYKSGESDFQRAFDNVVATARTCYSGKGIVLDEDKLPVRPATQAACELLGLDPLLVANEGKCLAIVPAEFADAMVERMRRDPLGEGAVVIGHVTAEHPGMVVAKTSIGGTRVVAMQIGEQLPRIC